MDKKSLSSFGFNLVQLRSILNQPLNKRPLLFKLCFPLLAFVSLIIFAVVFFRRKKSYLPVNTLPALTDGSIQVICVGNVLVGGSGKSPIVQKMALDYLEKNYIVAIASRGISHLKTHVYVNALSSTDNNFSLLSDENREHYELLKSVSNNFFILQNKNRFEAFCYFKTELEKILKSKISSNKFVFIMDDGLQHFSCPRHLNLCVWQPDLLLNSPNFCLPLGPYREGFGKKSFTSLLTEFDYRVWSRTPYEDLKLFYEKIDLGLKKYNLQKGEKDIAVCYELKVKRIKLINNEYSVEEIQDKKEFEKLKSAIVVTGIAGPEQFLCDLKLKFNCCENWNTLFLNDHAPFETSKDKILDIMSSPSSTVSTRASTVIFSMKDFYRWSEEQSFKEALLNRDIYGCDLDLHFYNLDGKKIDFLDLFCHFGPTVAICLSNLIKVY